MRQPGKRAWPKLPAAMSGAAALAATLTLAACSTPRAVMALPELVPVEVTLPHPVSAADALTLRSSLDVAELRWSALNAAGGVAASASLSDAEVLRNFEAGTSHYGYTPAITAVAVNLPAVSALNGVPKMEPTLVRLQRAVDDAAQRLPIAETQGVPRIPN